MIRCKQIGLLLVCLIVAVYMLVACAANPEDDSLHNEATGASGTGELSGESDTADGSASKDSAEVSSEEATEREKEHTFTIVMEESVYPVDFDSITFRVVCTEPGVTLAISKEFVVCLVESDEEIQVGISGTEDIYEIAPTDESTYASMEIFFTKYSLQMDGEFTEGTYRIYHLDDTDVYVEFELKN